MIANVARCFSPSRRQKASNQLSSPSPINNRSKEAGNSPRRQFTTPNENSPSLANRMTEMSIKDDKMNSPQSAKFANVNTTPRISKRRAAQNGEEPDDAIILKSKITQKEAEIVAKNARILQLENELRRESLIVQRKHPINPVQHVINENGRKTTKVGRSGSLATTMALEAIPEFAKSKVECLAEKFLEVFQNPVDHVNYLLGRTFASDILLLCEAVNSLFENEPRCLFMQSPVYVFGDIHGNLEDLHFFSDNIWKLGMDLTAGQFLFLGDYVDRGAQGLECVTYLFAMKLLYPRKLHLLRGNHETRDVNGWESHYREKCFLYQCKDRFGELLGKSVWEAVNKSFDRMPLAAVIDYDIFCIHGGIPRPIPECETSLNAILAVPNVSPLLFEVEDENETQWTRQVALDCMWSDPAQEEQELVMDETGFGDSLRGGGAICFGTKAIEDFLASNRLSFIIRAHEAKSHGVSLGKGARVFTVFSTSKDHNQGRHAMAGCILVDVDRIQVITRSSSYKNRYVHRRSSSCIGLLSESQVTERKKIGLIRQECERSGRFVEEEEEEEEEENVEESAYVTSAQEALLMEDSDETY